MKDINAKSVMLKYDISNELSLLLYNLRNVIHFSPPFYDYY